MKRQQVPRMVGAAALLACSLLFCGCESEDSNKDITATRFHLDRDLKSYNKTDVYDWDTTLSQAQFEIRIKDFRAGDAAVLVFDATGKQVLRSVLVTPNYTIYVGNNEFVRIGQTDSGTPGHWKVQLVYNQFTGTQQITMQ